MRKLPYIAFWLALTSSVSGLAMGLLPGDEGRAAWNALEGRVLAALGGNCSTVQQPAERLSTVSVAGASGGGPSLNKVVAATLHPMAAVRFVLNPEKLQGKPENTGGLLELTVPVTGIYVLGSVSQAWIDVVDEDARKFAKSKLYRWVDFCGGRMKAGVFELRAGARHWIQISASPEPAIDLFVAGPLNYRFGGTQLNDYILNAGVRINF